MKFTWEHFKQFFFALRDHIENGLRRVDSETYKNRMEVCLSCSEYESYRCRSCGCIVPIKAGWESEDCPLAKWSKEQT